MLCEEWNVVLSLPQWNHLDRKHVEPVVEVFAKTTGGHTLFQIAIRRGDDADVCRARAILAHALIAFFLEHAQKFTLHVQRHFTDFVQKQRAAFGRFKAAGAVLDGAGE